MVLVVADYSERAIAVFGDVNNAENKSALESKGGKFNPSLKGQPGFVFPKGRKAEISAFIESLKDCPPPAAPAPTIRQRKSTASEDDPRIDAKLVSNLLMRIERLETELACVKKIVLSQPAKNLPQENNYADSDEFSSESEEEEKRPRTLKSIKKI
jgi:hypothetical protein